MTGIPVADGRTPRPRRDEECPTYLGERRPSPHNTAARRDGRGTPGETTDRAARGSRLMSMLNLEPRQLQP